MKQSDEKKNDFEFDLGTKINMQETNSITITSDPQGKPKITAIGSNGEIVGDGYSN